MAGTAATKTGFPGIEIHGRSIRIAFMYKGVRHRHTLGMEPTRNNIKHAASLRSAALFALKTGNYNEADLIATRAVSTVNHYLATFSGFLYWCENNGYCGELGKHCVRFTRSNKDPDPLSYEEYQPLIDKGCLHPSDRAAVILAIYTGLRPGELPTLAVEDVATDFSKITVRRSIMLVNVYARWIDQSPPESWIVSGRACKI